MSKVFSALAVSVVGYITGRDPAPGRGLDDGGMLFDWYFQGDVASQVFKGFKLGHRPAPQMHGRQTLVTTGIADAVAAAREAAGDKDVALMGGGVVTEAL